MAGSAMWATPPSSTAMESAPRASRPTTGEVLNSSRHNWSYLRIRSIEVQIGGNDFFDTLAAQRFMMLAYVKSKAFILRRYAQSRHQARHLKNQVRSAKRENTDDNQREH